MQTVARRALRVVAFMTAGAVAAGSALLIFREFVEPYIDGRSAQAALWAFYEWAGWWWWGIAVVLSAVGLYYMFTLTAPKTTWGASTRVPLLTGFLCYSLSWGNNALGPLGGVLVLTGVVMLLKQISGACAVERRKAPQPEGPLSYRMLTVLTHDGK